MRNRLITLKQERGVIAISIILIILSVALILSLSVVVVFANRVQAMKNFSYSEQAYYAAEAGIEDALLRLMDLNKDLPGVLPYTLSVGPSSTVEIDIQENIGGVSRVSAKGDKNQRIREIGVIATLNTTEGSLIYGAQVGAGGIEMSNGSTILGSVYSNGSIDGDSGAEITGDAYAALNGNSIEDVGIGGNAYAHSFKDCSVTGNIVYVTGGEVDNCTAGGTTTEQSEEIPALDMPISDEIIDGWKQDATDGGIISGGDYTPTGGSTVSIGPGVIVGNLIMTNNQTIVLLGTVWVQGNIDIDNGSAIRLDSSYGINSGVIITDGWIHIKNNGEFVGSGQEGSYMMLLSTVVCRGIPGGDCTDHNAAMDLHNNASGAIFYASEGLIYLHNNVEIAQINAWGISLGNNVVIEYAIGLADIEFSSGPSGGWTVNNWREQ